MSPHPPGFDHRCNNVITAAGVKFMSCCHLCLCRSKHKVDFGEQRLSSLHSLLRFPSQGNLSLHAQRYAEVVWFSPINHQHASQPLGKSHLYFVLGCVFGPSEKLFFWMFLCSFLCPVWFSSNRWSWLFADQWWSSYLMQTVSAVRRSFSWALGICQHYLTNGVQRCVVCQQLCNDLSKVQLSSNVGTKAWN